jgi:predicted ATPase
MERLLSDRHLNLDSSFSYILLNSIIENESLSSKLRYWLNEFNIAEDFVVTEDDEIIRLYLIKNGSRINIKDLGYGCSQLVPLLIYVIGVDNSYQGNVKIIVEEPEVNLHPSLQSKLADFLVEMAMLKRSHLLGVEFIVETHSEYLIRKLQYLVATKKLNENEAVIYYFNDTSQQMKSGEKVFKININKDGSLTRNFGPGFFDEADNIALDLFNLQNNSN